MLIDTHCHLYLEEFKEDIDQVIARAEDVGVGQFYLPGINSSTIEDMLALEHAFPGKCFAMMGLHPCYVGEHVREELATVNRWLRQRPFAAVGEIGLDFYHDTTYKEQQYTAFRQQVEWALELGLPIVIHSRNAMQETIDVVREYKGRGLKGIFHCFSGSEADAHAIIETGLYLGIGGVLTYKNAGLGPVLENIGLEHMVLETDAPYLTPVPFRGKRNESSYLTYIADRLSAIKKLPAGEITAITTANAQKIFGC